jgi:uncharacterized PurR-regulated membrane protein YhhQ (DUF165 family)
MVQMTPHHDKSAEFLESGVYRPGASLADPDQPVLPSARPLGLGLVVVVSFLLGIVLLIALVAIIFQPSDTSNRAYWMILPALIALVLSVGLWQLYPWARIVAVVFYALLAVTALMSAFNSPFTLGALATIGVPALPATYLLSRRAREVFGRKAA